MRTQQLIILILLVVIGANTQAEDKTVVREGVIEQDTYLAGERVMVDALAKGDLVIGASVIKVKGTVDGDLIAAGGEIAVTATLNDDARLIGGQLSLCSDVGGDLVLAGADINICSDTSVVGNSFMAGRDLTVEGEFKSNLTAKGARITLAATIVGNANLEAEQIELLPGAVIMGNLEYKSPNSARIHEGAVISGEEIYSISESDWWADPSLDAMSIVGIALTIALLGTLGIAIAGTVLVIFFPYVMQRTTTLLTKQMLPCVGIGLVVIVLTPIISLVLLLTVIGAPLAALLFVAFLLALTIGFYTSLICLADALGRLFGKSAPLTTQWRILSILLAALLVALIGVVPILGGLLLFLFYLAGVGAVVTFIRETRQTSALL